MADTDTTPTPDASAPALMLSGGMTGPPPQFDPSQQPNVIPTQPGATPTPGMTGPPPQFDAGQPPPVSTGAASDPEMVAAAHHHGRVANAIDAVSKALGGSKTMKVVEQPDGSFIAKEMDSTPGERWSRIAKAALSGAAAGFAHGQGPGGGARAFAAGVDTGLQLPQTEQDQTMKKADDLEGQRQKQIMFKKNMALLDIQQAKGNLDLMESPQKFRAELQDYADKREKGILAQHGVYLATYANAKDLSDHMQTNQDLLDGHVGKGAQLDQVPVYDSSGKQVGVKVYGIPQDSLNQYNADPENILVEKMSPDNKSIETSYRSYKPGQSLNSDILADRKQQDTQNQAVHLNFAKLQNETMTANAAKLKAETDEKESASRIAKNYAEASKARGDVDNPDLKLTGDVDPSSGMPLMVDKKGNMSVAKVPQGMTPMKATDLATFRKTYQAPAVKAEQAYGALKQMDANVQAGIVNPVEQRTAVRMAMSEAAGFSPTTGAGGRGGMSSADFKTALKARGIADDKVNLIENFLNGAQITKGQSRDIVASYNLLRRATWRTAADMGAVSGMKPEDVIPTSVLGRDKIMGEIYAAKGQPQGTGNTGQAARQPGQEQQPQLPKPMTDTQRYPIRPSVNGGSEQWDGQKYVQVQQ